jgi:hypothetical protein
VRRVWRWLAGSALRRERRVTTNPLLRLRRWLAMPGGGMGLLGLAAHGPRFTS